MKVQPRITIVMPCYKRPLRTQAAIASIKAQTVVNFEAFVLGDGDPGFLPVEDDIRFISFNFPHNTGGYGYTQVNYAIRNATGKYFVFMGNDDTIDPDHFQRYLRAIEGTDFDFVFFPRVKMGTKNVRFELKSWQVGHCSVIIRTDFLKRMPLHTGDYGHDWQLIKNMVSCGKYRMWENMPTYHIDPYGARGTDFDDDRETRSDDRFRWHSKIAKRVKKLLIALKLYKA